MIKQIVSFLVVLTLGVAVVFSIHIYALNQLGLPLFDHMIVKAYGVNYFFALLVFALIVKLASTNANIVGFVFMGSSLLKFTAFFIIFYPIYNLDDEMSRPEFLTFFIPYVVCLVLETTFLIKYLNTNS